MLHLTKSPKKYTHDQDKACSPQETIARVKERLSNLSITVLAKTERIDKNILEIPVFLSRCGQDACAVMPTKKQMGKGATLAQAEASALMELIERYSYFTFWQQVPHTVNTTWSEAKKYFGEQLIPLAELNQFCDEALSDQELVTLLDLRKWIFAPTTHIATGHTVYIPVDLCKMFNEFNGSSAGNTNIESILQGSCELVERHVSALIDKNKPTLPTISLVCDHIKNPVLKELIEKFKKNNITLILKDMSLGMPVPTIGALAINPATFPTSSEIVFTAGTACTPEKAAIRAITEVAQLAGDFCTNSCYEASGLPKYMEWEETKWLQVGPTVLIETLPKIDHDDMLDELKELAQKLETMRFQLYSFATTNPTIDIPAHYSLVPGFQFRERDKTPSLGMFIGRFFTENTSPDEAIESLKIIDSIYPDNHFVPFFRGLIALEQNDFVKAREFFSSSAPLQPNTDAKALVAFYHAYTYTQEELWEQALPLLNISLSYSYEFKEAVNLRGLCYFRLQKYEKAALDFTHIVTVLDKSSGLDLFNLGMCYKRLNKIDDAAKYLLAAFTVDPTFLPAKEQLAELAKKPDSTTES